MKIHKFSALVLVIITLTSCTFIERSNNRKNLMKLDLGMTKYQVIELMGTPQFSEMYQTEDDVSMIVLYYYTSGKWLTSGVTRQQCTPLVFENKKLVGWGREFYTSRILHKMRNN